ncbi:hypothetical protein ACQ4LE_008482 [Meloidogyne hapla]
MLGRLILPRLRIPLGSSIPKGNIGALDIGTGHDKPLLSSPNQLATSPDGDGGVYQAILPIIPKLEQNGIEYFHVYCADNILCRVPDLHMIGCAIDKKADCISKVIEKNNPYEKIGLVCIEDEKIKLYDHSKISKGLIGKRYPKFPEKLLLHAGYIGNQFFTLDFLKKACFEFDSLPSHQVRKRMPFWDPVYGKNIQPTIGVNGIKRKLFIFDSFVHANNRNLTSHLAFRNFCTATDANKNTKSSVNAKDHENNVTFTTKELFFRLEDKLDKLDAKLDTSIQSLRSEFKKDIGRVEYILYGIIVAVVGACIVLVAPSKNGEKKFEDELK